MTGPWFTIDTDNVIRRHATEQDVISHPDMRFAFADESSLVIILEENNGLAQCIWNALGTPKHALAGGPVGAARRIWKAIRHEFEYSQLREFVELIARMKTEEEFGHDVPASEDWISTLNDLIVTARGLL